MGIPVSGSREVLVNSRFSIKMNIHSDLKGPSPFIMLILQDGEHVSPYSTNISPWRNHNVPTTRATETKRRGRLNIQREPRCLEQQYTSSRPSRPNKRVRCTTGSG